MTNISDTPRIPLTHTRDEDVEAFFQEVNELAYPLETLDPYIPPRRSFSPPPREPEPMPLGLVFVLVACSFTLACAVALGFELFLANGSIQ